MSSGRGTSGASTVAAVQELANRVHALAVEAGRADLAGDLASEAGRFRAPGATVVVVGAARRGKSSLVNALVGRAGLLPVEQDVTTGVHVAVHHAESPVAVLHRLDDDEPTPLPDLDIAPWVTESANPRNSKGVRLVEVGVDAPLLADGLVLVDTPGVDSVESRHLDVTMAALPLADALLFVVDASRPLLASELAFLEQATARIGTVAFALTKVDAFPGWETIRDEDRALLAAHAPRFADAPIFPVSSTVRNLADRASAAGREDMAERARSDSGVPALEEQLQAITGRAAAVRLRNLLQLVLGVADRVELVASTRLRGTGEDPGLTAAFEADSRRLREVAESSARWRQDLDFELRRLQMDVEARASSAFAELEREYEEGGAFRRGAAEDLVGELDGAVRVVALDVTTLMADRLTAVVERLTEDLGADALDPSVLGIEAPALTQLADVRAPSEVDPQGTGLGGVLNTYGPLASTTFLFSHVLGSLGLADPSSLGVAAILGALGLSARLRASASARAQRETSRLVQRVLASARSELARHTAGSIMALRRALEAGVAAGVERRRAELEAAVQDAQKAMRATAAERRAAAAEATAQLERLGPIRTEATALRAALGRVVLVAS